MPEPLRISGHVAVEALDRAWGGRTLVPPADLTTAVPRILARASVTGGSSCDALVALTAQGDERTFISLGFRVERTYRLLGITYRLQGWRIATRIPFEQAGHGAAFKPAHRDTAGRRPPSHPLLRGLRYRS